MEGLVLTVFGVVGYIWDRLTFIPWFFLSGVGRKLELARRVKARPVDPNDPTGPWKSCDAPELVETYYTYKTMTEVFNASIKRNAHLPLFGTRELLAEEDEVQPNGKVFKKAIYGKYKWETYGEVGQKVMDFAAGLTALGINDRVAIYMETRADFQIAIQACWQHNIQVVTVYATLGEVQVADALVEAEVTHIITSASLLETRLKSILASNPSIKSVVFAPHENHAQKIKYTPPADAKHSIYPYEVVYNKGKTSKLPRPAPPTPETKSVIMYTSGTSGKAKGVIISQANMVAACSGIGEKLQVHTRFTPDDIFIGYLPLAHILELMAENCMIFNGSRIGYSSPLTLSDRSTRIKKGTKGDATELKPTLMASVPEILERVRKGVMANVEEMKPMQKMLFKFAYAYKEKQVAMGRDTPILNALIFKKTAALLGGNMRAMLSGGAPLEVKTQRFIEVCIRAPLVIGYGLTETTGGVAINDICDAFRTGRTGGVIDTGLMKLVEWKEGGYSPRHNPPTGEVWAGGHMVAHGYYKMPEKTAEDFHTDANGIRWFKTGDIGKLDEDGSIILIDRKKDLVKLRHGEYIALGKIEAALKTSPLLTNVGVFVDPNELTCVAIVVGNELELQKVADKSGLSGDFSTWSNAAQIRAAVKDSLIEASKASKLSKLEMPSNFHIETLQWLPETGLVTDAFKIKRKALNEHYAKTIAALYKK